MRDDEGRKSDGEGTFAGTRGNDEYAPKADRGPECGSRRIR
jgi:hypothetical protein